MILKKLKLSNFRCFGESVTIIDINKFTTIIGNNSTGKTAAMYALMKIFSDRNSDRVIKANDFHVLNNAENENTKSLFIESIFEFSDIGEGGMSGVPDFFSRI